MNVVLAQTSPFVTHRSWNYVEQLGLGFLEKALSNGGFGVDVFDATMDWAEAGDSARRILSASAGVGLIGFSVNRSNLGNTLEAIRLVRDGGFRGHITLGGHFPTFHHEKLLKNAPEIDSVVLGHGEYTLCRLAESVAAGASWEDVPGLASREAGGGTKRSFCYENEAFLKGVGIPVHRPRYGIARMITSRGCAWGCTFCCVQSFDIYNFKSRYQRRDLDEVLDELDRLVKDHKVHHVWLSDMDFVGIDKRFIHAFCEALIRRGHRLTLEGDCRVDALDEPLIQLLARAGFNAVYMGVESFAKGQTDRYRKFRAGFEPEERVLSVVNLLRKHGIVPRFGFIMFDKDSLFADLKLNHEVIQRTVGYGTLDGLANRMALLPGTKIEANYLQDAAHCHRVEVNARNREESHLYYTQYSFRDPRVAFVYEASFSYRNKFARLQELFDARLRAGEINYDYHYTVLWRLRDLFGDIYTDILALAETMELPGGFPRHAADRSDRRLIDFCVALGIDEADVEALLAAEYEHPGERQP